ncbi:MAG: hypothetical protein JO006_18995 [Paucibacter sp.]|nr:hypothetical protein [Roseateles sp.]
MTTKSRLVISILVMVALVLGLLVLNDWLVSQSQIGGPLYEEIDHSHALVADLLPPPLFVVEAHELAHELADATSERDDRRLLLIRARLAELQAEFESRQRYWNQVALPEPLRRTLSSRVQESAAQYFRIMNGPFLAVINKGDALEARQLLRDTLQPVFLRHRMGVLEAVYAVRTYTEALEQEVRTRRSKLAWRMALFGLALLGAAGLLLYLWCMPRVLAGRA